MILLDTHVLVRYMHNEGKLGKRTLSVIDRAVADDQLFVSAISFWEVATLVAKGRLELDTTAAAFRDLALRNGVREQVIDGDIATLAGELPDAHGDPADRMLVATAILRGLTLVTADAVLLDWKLRGFRTRDATEWRAWRAPRAVVPPHTGDPGVKRPPPAGLDGRERHKLSRR